ncbi:MAG: 50S ribosomal protein L17 [Candidatus Omnitrophota bacterium]|nr:50S ribosomal protein L17 [Candidatus Omnitrophota bacterium]
MRHRKGYKRLDRNKPERDSLMRNLVRGLFISQSIKTTIVKAKEARKLAERLISVAKKDDLHSRRKVFAVLRDEDLVAKLFKEIAPLFKGRNGGYTRIIQFGMRRGDNAQLVILELTEKKVIAPKVKKPSAQAPKAAPKEVTPPPAEKPKEVTPEKHPPRKKEARKEKEMHPAPKAPTGFIGTLRKFFRGRTK